MQKDSLNKDSSGIICDISSKENLLVSFGGVQQGIGIPVFEFFNFLSAFDCDKVFVRDFNQAWYQKGIDDKISTIDQLTQSLREIIANRDYKKICFIGNSMGGYAAILFGVLLGVDEVLSFAPQTFVDKKRRLLHADFRWKKEIKGMYKSDVLNRPMMDLKSYLLQYPKQAKPIINIFYGANHRLDRIHAERMKKISNVCLFPIPGKNHQLVKELRNSGQLNKMFEELFA